MVTKYGKVGKSKVYIMSRATKKYAPKGFVVVQSIKTGETSTIKRSKLKR